MKRFELKSGGGRIEFDLCDFGGAIDLLDPQYPEAIDNPKEAIRRRLDNPDCGPPLAEMLPSSGRIVILAADNTRRAAQPRVIGVLVEYILSHNPGAEIIVVFASGIHRPLSENEKTQLAGPLAADRCRLIDNNGGRGNHRPITGEFDGLKPELLTEVLDADLIIQTGAVLPHYLAGFGGGRKSFLPGVASAETALAYHSSCLASPPALGRRPECAAGNLIDNPMHRIAEQVMLALGPIFSVNLIVDGAGRPAQLFTGDPVESFRLAAKAAAEIFLVEVTTGYDIVFASAGGLPKDINLVQTHKAISFASGAVADGGTLILAAECSEGAGSQDLIDFLQLGSSEKIARTLIDNFKINGQTALSLYEKSERIKIITVGGAGSKLVELFGATAAANTAEAIAAAEIGPTSRIAVIPSAGDFCYISRTRPVQ